MVNRELRQSAANLIRRYLASEIINDDFADEFPRDRSDRALQAIEQRLWLHYDDVRIHHCEFPLRSPTEELWKRCALFLDSEHEYEWTELRFHNEEHPIIGVLTGSIFRHRSTKHSKCEGDYVVWPFLRRSDFEAARLERSQEELKADDEFITERLDHFRVTIAKAVAILQTALFFSAIVLALYSYFGHSKWWGTSILCLGAYLLLFALGFLIQPTADTERDSA
jgi:hypothetical protein